MDIELKLSHSYFHTYYHHETVLDWQKVWNTLLRMAYLREGIVDRLAVLTSQVDDLCFYERQSAKNYYEITFEYSWREFCKTHKDSIHVVPELKEVYVPKCLFQCPGVWALFNYSFPNCKVIFWT